MAMKRSACPWWLTWGVALAVLCVFLGERPLADKQTLRYVFSGGGFVFLLGATALRAWAWLSADGARKRIERILLLSYLGATAALVIYFAGSDVLAPEPSRLWSSLKVVWPILLACSLLPAMAAQWAIGTPLAAAGADADDSHAESHRVAELATSALNIALVASFLFVAMFIAKERDKKIDVSYFKTSSPGSSTVAMVDSLDQKLEVLLFFPPISEVKDEVVGYFRELADATGKVEIRQLDRLVDSKLAEKYRVAKEGVITLVKGDQHRNITVNTELKRARAKLRDLDSEVQKAFMKVARDARTAYITIGHGELNDPSAAQKGVRDPMRKIKIFRDILTALNYRVKDLGLRQGLSQEVPDDATMVIVLGPTDPFLDSELEALDRYLLRGGAVFFALEPDTEFSLGLLESRLGLKFIPQRLVDEKAHIIMTRSISDRQNIVTDQFSSHASVTTLSRSRAGSGILLVGAGSFDDVKFSDDYGKNKPKRTWVIRSLSSSFRDLNGDFSFQADTEKTKTYNLIAAVEGPKQKPKQKTPRKQDDDEKDEKDKKDKKAKKSDASAKNGGS